MQLDDHAPAFSQDVKICPGQCSVKQHLEAGAPMDGLAISAAPSDSEDRLHHEEGCQDPEDDVEYDSVSDYDEQDSVSDKLSSLSNGDSVLTLNLC